MTTLLDRTVSPFVLLLSLSLSACGDADPEGTATDAADTGPSSGADGGPSSNTIGATDGGPDPDGTAGDTTSDTADDTAGDTDTGDPPPPSCDGQAVAVDELGTTPGRSDAPFPTLEHISLVWAIEGDSNADGTVTVRYRPEGGTWREGTPLRRVPAGSTHEGFSWTNKHAGSLFGLTAATTYEVEMYLSDPDGGCEIRNLEVTTRAVPEAMPGAPVVDVTPATFDAALGAAAPGDVLELAAGTYPGFTVQTDGNQGAPIVIRAAGDVTIGGDVRIDNRVHVIVEGLEVDGQIKFNGASFIAVKGCTVNATEDGIALRTRGENVYIADNVVQGQTSWTEAALGVDGDNIGEGIIVTGPGHVIEHNRVTGFRDAISFLEGEEAVDQYSLDVLRNDIDSGADDGIEADFCEHNCRIVGNRLTNTFIAMSSQPGLGGPTYFVRNAAYNVILSAFKLQRASVGDVLWHNTVVKNGDALGIYTSDVFSRQEFRNNLFLGGPGGTFNGYSSGSGDVVSLTAADPSVDLDYDGFGSDAGAFAGQIGDVQFASLAEMMAMTTEVHAVQVDRSTVFAAAVPYPAAPFPALDVPDLRIATGSAAVDAGVVIPGIDDDHTGAAPDLGAYEAGGELPVVGPRR